MTAQDNWIVVWRKAEELRRTLRVTARRELELLDSISGSPEEVHRRLHDNH